MGNIHRHGHCHAHNRHSCSQQTQLLTTDTAAHNWEAVLLAKAKGQTEEEDDEEEPETRPLVTHGVAHGCVMVFNFWWRLYLLNICGGTVELLVLISY